MGDVSAAMTMNSEIPRLSVLVAMGKKNVSLSFHRGYSCSMSEILVSFFVQCDADEGRRYEGIRRRRRRRRVYTFVSSLLKLSVMTGLLDDIQDLLCECLIGERESYLTLKNVSLFRMICAPTVYQLSQDKFQRKYKKKHSWGSTYLLDLVQTYWLILLRDTMIYYAIEDGVFVLTWERMEKGSLQEARPLDVL